MRDFSWKYFAMTGDVDAYMLFKESDTALGQTAEDGALNEQQLVVENEEEA
ncbi:hypothetical protein J2Z32_000943 [Paenibacillus turicensis]|jgi:hypothetical protein|uniref:YqzL family protein n=1 Tax=Paenibacillus turicensis TaxID=160487 RepID=A0ABS4FP18_9BACL|nr:YqzL family protein [Paenibacillus turicensis]MBP1904326.1 hypothetical protein [Paenibacillus turicensis]